MPKKVNPAGNKSRLAIESEHLQIIRAVLRVVLPEWPRPQSGRGGAGKVRIYVFGSRARGTMKKAADLDLAIDAGRQLTSQEEAELKERFEESDLPYKVDITDLQAVSADFAALIKADIIPLF